MTSVLWEPEDRKPDDAASLEAEMAHVAPGAQIKITFREGRWLVRALAPAAMCARGAEFSGRDVSEAVAQILLDHDHPASSRL